MLLHVIKEANDVVKDVIKETDDVVKGKANVTKEFAKAQRQIYKLISQMPQISAAQMSENLGIANPQVLSVEHFSIADCKSARTPDGIYQLACL